MTWWLKSSEVRHVSDHARDLRVEIKLEIVADQLTEEDYALINEWMRGGGKMQEFFQSTAIIHRVHELLKTGASVEDAVKAAFVLGAVKKPGAKL